MFWMLFRPFDILSPVHRHSRPTNFSEFPGNFYTARNAFISIEQMNLTSGTRQPTFSSTTSIPFDSDASASMSLKS
jgi:hypothetical protein